MQYTQEGLRRLETLSLEAPMPQGARFMTEAGPLEVVFYAPGLLRLHLGTSRGPDYGLLVAPPDPIEVSFAAKSDGYRLEGEGVALELVPSPLRLRLYLGERLLLESTGDGHIRGGLRIAPFAQGNEEWVVALGLRSGEPVYGLGEKFGPLNRRGQLVVSWNEDSLGVNAEASYKNIPFAWSPQGWGLFVHTTARVLHGVGYPQWSHRSYLLRVEEPALDLFLLAAPTPAVLLERFTHLTGRTPLPPRWSFGVWMSRCYYSTAEEALSVARTLRERSIPCDVLVLDGRAWLKVETRFAFQWDQERYPDPAAFIRQLKALDFRLCLWEYPYVSVHNPLFNELAAKGYLLRTPSGEPYVYRWNPEPFGTLLTVLPPSGMVDFTNPEAYAWYSEAHRSLFAIGVDVMKTDFGEQVPEDAVACNGDNGERLHNVYPLLYNRCVYEASERYAQGGALVWGRSGWTGSQRYPIQWGGDPQCDWEGLAASIRGGLSWGMSGGAFYAHDIGGFYRGKPDPELYVRWTQAGVMAPHTRFHGIGPREPWEFGAEAERIVREWLSWRYRLLPYLEACALEAQRSGLAVMRAMPLAFPDDPLARGFDEQYLLGPALLVAPVLVPGGKVRLYLPTGGWYDLWSGERLEGPRLLERTVPLEQMPIYGREGLLLPLGPAVQHTGELGSETRLEEVWAFGLPQQGIELPGLILDVEVREGQSRLSNLPVGVQVRPWGRVRIEPLPGGAWALSQAS